MLTRVANSIDSHAYVKASEKVGQTKC
jgi:hypothetical protein